MRYIEIAHSPDADDIFMYYAIRFGWIGALDYLFKNYMLDIETLNVEALKGTFDLSAISFSLYPHIKNEYALIKTAASFGDGYGPKLIKRADKKLKANFKVALSGKYTTNAMLFKIVYPKARIVYMNFLEIKKAVLDGIVDAGVLIHESILDIENELSVERELWDIWCELCNEILPLPLGGMAIRRSIPLLNAIYLEEALSKAILLANKNKKLMCKMLLERGLLRVDGEKLDRYLCMYANSHELSEIQIRALNKLYEIGYKYQFYSEPIDIRDYFIPSEYRVDRFS